MANFSLIDMPSESNIFKWRVVKTVNAPKGVKVLVNFKAATFDHAYTVLRQKYPKLYNEMMR